MYLVAQDPQWAYVTPFALTSPDEFRPAPPPALDSAAYAASVEEIRLLGAANSATRTADQTVQAQFWSDGGGTYTPPGHWNQLAETIALSQGNSLSDNVRLFAQLNVALADSAIACWDAKYTYDLWRPLDAIHYADQDNNAATQQDANWVPLLITPPHPEYVSGHSTFSMAAATVLADVFGDDTAFTATSYALPGVTRNFTSFTQAAEEAGRSRIYGGIHYEFTNEAGQQLGRDVANAVLARFALNEDTQPPTVVAQATGNAINTNLTLSGQILDNLSGVASAQYRVDNGALQSLSLDAQGHFSLSTSFLLDGSADGAHSVSILSSDAAGNVAGAYTRAFTLDTRAPNISLTSLAEGATLTTSSRLTGSADATGSALTALNYRFDGGTLRALSYNPSTGAFDTALPLGNLAIGDHTLTLTAQDAAGNSVTFNRSVTLAAAAPFTLTSVTPTNGAGDVGVTYRPQIVFSRAVNAATLTADSLYATGPDGQKIAATIVPALDGSFAWLLFSSSLSGSSTITLHVDGSKIRAAADGLFLDADSDGVAGGVFTSTFTTVSTTTVAGTKLVGRVVDPGPDLDPMTFDDIGRGPDGIIHTADDVFKLPIAGVKVWILGQEAQVVYTDANGYFELTSVPVGDVKLAVDGRTATNAPTGVFFPEMVMDLTIRAGVTNTAMGSMGTTQTQAANAGREEIYLPRVADTVLQDVSNDTPTTITVGEGSAPDLSDEQRARLTLTVDPGSAIGADGQTLTNVQIGISTVPPELVKDMLPPGVLEHTFDITIQAPGVTAFTEPLQITLPNVFGAAPGTQLNILSFDHTTGRLVINGTGTVSADGLTVVSDPGSGIRAPGWHGLTPPGDPSDPPCPPNTPHTVDVPPVMQTSGVQDYFFTKDSGNLNLSFANFATKINPNLGPCDPVNDAATPLLIEVSLDDFAASEFMDNLATQSFSLEPGQVGNINASVATLLDIVAAYDHDALYGVKINIHAHWIDKDGVDHNLDGGLPATSIYAYRFLDIADNRHEDGKMDFSRTTAAGTYTQRDPLDYFGDPAAQPTNIAVTSGSDFSYAGGEVRFDPGSVGNLSSQLAVTAPDAKVVGKIDLAGVGIALQNVYFSHTEFAAKIKALVDAGAPTADARLLAMFPDTDGNGSRTTGVDKAGFDATVAQLANDIDVEFYVTMLGVDPTALGTVTIVDGTPGTGDKVNLRNQALEPSAALYNGGAAAVWADFGITYFLNNLVPNEGTMSLPQTEYLFAGLFDRSDSDTSGSSFVPGGTGMIVNLDVDTAAVPAAAATPAAYRSALVNQLASTIGHEFGHLLGAIHQRTNTAPYSSNYLMGLGTLLTTIPAIGPDFIGVFKAALGMPLTDAEFQAAYDYYKLQANNDYTIVGQAYAFNNGGNPVPGPGHLISLDNPVPYLAVVDGPADDHLPPNVIHNLDFGTVLADGAGGELASQTIWLFNTGGNHLDLNSVEILGSSGFKVTGFGGPTMLESFDEANPAPSRLPITLTYDPSALGDATATLRITSDSSGGTVDIPLSGLGRSPNGHLMVDVPNNNLGGVKLGQSKTVNGFATLSNDGAQALTITSIVDPSGQYQISGLPANFPTTPITLQAGETMQINVSFSPDATGLRPDKIVVTSNDPLQPTYQLAVTATGLSASGTALDYGNDFVALSMQNVLRTVSDAGGNWSFFLPSQTPFQYTIFDPISGLVAHSGGVTAPSGQHTQMPTPVFVASTTKDSDGDGLPDDIEFAIGTNANSRDTDKDGLDDFTEIKQGLDPLGGLGIPVGVASAAQLQGSAEAVAVAGSIADPSKITAYVATGTYGLAVVDASQITKPNVLAQLDLPGMNTDVAVDAARALVVVAGNDAGLHIVDISTPTAPVLEQTVQFGDAASRVELRDGIAYVAVGDSVITVDINTGEVRQTLDLGNVGGSTLTDLVFDGDTLYTTDSNRNLRSIGLTGETMTLLDTLNLPAGNGRLFVGNGVAYIGAGNGGTGGYLTADVSDPANLALLSNVDNNALAGTAMALNGSGLAVAVGSSSFVFGAFRALDVLNTSDPTDTSQFVTRINLPEIPKDVALANGLAFVADGTGGLQIVNYIGFDTQGVAPTVTISVDGVDADPNTPGVQVLEGRSVRVLPLVSDDVQVRNVELLVNGQVVSNDVSFPFELFAQTPTIAQGGSTLSIQVRATDTGGNTSLSNLVNLTVVPDTFPPQLVSSSVSDGDHRFFVKSIDLTFDEPLDTTRITPAGVSLVRAGADGLFGTADDVSVSVTLDFRAQGQSISVLPSGYLPPGDYRLRVDHTLISDRPGNVLTTDIVRTFNIRPASDVKASSGVAEILTAPSANPGQQIGISVPFDPSTAKADFKVIDSSGNKSTTTVGVARWDSVKGVAYFNVPYNAVTDDAVVYSLVNNVRTDFADGTFLLQILPVVTSVEVTSVSGDGSSATVQINGYGFVEGNNSEYRLGTQTITDAGTTTGPSVDQIYDSGLAQYVNGRATLTVPLSDGVFGPISVKTAGGTSASYSVSLTSITATALSGTPTDAGQASANAGQAITLNGSGLTTNTDVLLRWTDINGNPQMTRLSPSAAEADGTSATLLIPVYANGAFALQVFGSSSQPLLQIVPTLTRYDQQSSPYLYGTGFVENASSYNFAGVTATDIAGDTNIDVYYGDLDQNGRAYLDRTALPTHGLGNVTVTTAGGTSAPFALNVLQVNVTGTNLGDIAVAPSSGAIWITDYTNPGHLLRIDPANGSVLQTITLTSGFGLAYSYNYTGLQVLGAAMSLNGVNVPAGSLLLFNGYVNPDRVIAVDPSNGNVIASLTLDTNHDLTSGLYDPVSGHLFLLAHNSNNLVELDPASGATLHSYAVPINIQSWSGIAIDPVTGNFWIGSTSGGSDVVEINKTGVEIRRVNLASQGIDQGEISGLAFDTTGKLLVASTQGVVYQVTLS
jgi:hypothetical protein